MQTSIIKGVIWQQERVKILFQAAEDQIRIFTVETEPNSLTVQLTIRVEEEHLKGLDLLCLSTIPAFSGHHVRHSHYADHRSTSISSEYKFYPLIFAPNYMIFCRGIKVWSNLEKKRLFFLCQRFILNLTASWCPYAILYQVAISTSYKI